MGRIGKIARLPRAVREEVNGRIEDGEPARPLLEWLNAHPETQEALWEYFGGCAITEQNLSEWKQRGFPEWQKRRETRELAREFIHEAEELEHEVGETPLTDRMTEMVALSLARLLQEVMNDREKSPGRLGAVLGIAREHSRLRRGDHAMQQMRREQKMRDEAAQEAEREDEVQELVEEQEKIAHLESWTETCYRMRREKFEADRKEGRLSPEKEREEMASFAKTEEYLAGIRKRGPLPTRRELRRRLDGGYFQFQANPTKSD